MRMNFDGAAVAEAGLLARQGYGVEDIRVILGSRYHIRGEARASIRRIVHYQKFAEIANARPLTWTLRKGGSHGKVEQGISDRGLEEDGRLLERANS